MKLHFEALNRQEKKKPLMILHGFLGSLDNWKMYAKKFIKHYSIYLVDLRNHGLSPHSNEFNYQVMIEDLEALIQQQGLKEISLIGHSMGGKLAIGLTKKRPEWVDNLIVIDISPKKYKDIQSKKIIDIISKIDLKKFSNRFQVKEVLNQKIKNQTKVNFLTKSIKQEESGQLKWRFNLVSFKENIDFLGEEIKIPTPLKTKTLFVKGGNSNYITKADLNLIKEKFLNQKTIVIPDSGHWVHYEKGKELFEEIKKFLNLY